MKPKPPPLVNSLRAGCIERRNELRDKQAWNGVLEPGEDEELRRIEMELGALPRQTAKENKRDKGTA
jgi:hypothetical protein